MPNEEFVVERGEGDDPGEAQQAQLDARMEGALEKAATLELAGPQDYWNIWAVGPYQDYGLQPNRIIQLGEPAWIYTYVYLNPVYPRPYPGQNACDQITGFGAKIELNYFTSNTQLMQPVADLNHVYCIQTKLGQCYYRHKWVFTPTQAACIYETNICARICNCDLQPVPQYAGFVRWVYDLDVDYLFPPTGWGFDRPIRYMVSDMSDCYCPNLET
jgi:hypothetical protein